MTHARSPDVIYVSVTNLKLGLVSPIQRTSKSDIYSNEQTSVDAILKKDKVLNMKITN